MNFDKFRRLMATTALASLTASAIAGTTSAQSKEPYSPYVRADYPEQVFWGDTHLHTNFSLDADLGGALRVTADQSYAHARGEEVTTSSRQSTKLSRPLDFVVVADHAEYMGLWRRFRANDPLLNQSEVAQGWQKTLNEKPAERMNLTTSLLHQMMSGQAEFRDPEFENSVWQKVVANAEKYNEPGVFTAFAGYEWTSMPGGDNLHRVVIFKDDAETVSKTIPFSSFDSQDPEDLWKFFETYEAETGGEVLAIPHNGNVSNGLMFAPQTMDGDDLDKAYAETRARWEPLFEVTQIKGDSETHPLLSPEDPFADFETWDLANLELTAAKQDWMLQYEYARSALLAGLAYDKSLGANPFKFGMIGSTDSHTGMSAVEENNFWGKSFFTEPSRFRTKGEFFRQDDLVKYIWELSAAGYAGIWAQENTRESLFDAMMRRETYASTGPRMTVRFFGGWDFDPADADRSNLAEIGYTRGVPMGGDLTANPEGGAPRFLIRAVKDPEGANLDRVQVVKGWLDGSGSTHEKIYDVALSDGRTAEPGSPVAPVGNTVDLETATYLNSIGDPELSTVWTDPDFDPDQRAFYYLRVLEIPTPRWTAYDAAFYGIELPEGVPTTLQERAYTSPIWYTP
ncbi:DUF3604 domain-containing protein [Henriciella litoralis]|uniref:DUF3604 domain-containing protein n=1 Tax=Henriciella litoralis TaxID=568102 RepID=UPI000A030AE4|nr:DUF3604 domain-containing protein [Henriciella litoralis]